MGYGSPQAVHRAGTQNDAADLSMGARYTNFFHCCESCLLWWWFGSQRTVFAALAAQTIGCLLLGVLTIPLTAATDGNPVAGALISVALVPLINLWGPATVSSRCDHMRDRLNEIRVDENVTE